MGPIRELAIKALERRGVTADAVMERLQARLYSITLKNAKDDYGNDISVEMEDSSAQLRAIEIYADIAGLKAPTKVEHSGELKLTVEEQRREQNRVFGDLVGLK